MDRDAGFFSPSLPFRRPPCKGGPNARKSASQEKQDRPWDRLGGTRSPIDAMSGRYLGYRCFRMIMVEEADTHRTCHPVGVCHFVSGCPSQPVVIPP